jgi:hypothetical protein
VRYKADITAGALKLPESRLIADLLLRQVDAELQHILHSHILISGNSRQKSRRRIEQKG